MISIVVPTVDIGMLNATLPGWLALATTEGEVIVVNGSEESPEQIRQNLSWMKKWDLRIVNEMGNSVVQAMWQGYKLATGEIIVFLHDDVFIYEQGWDDRIALYMDYDKAGLVGFGGCTELAADTQTSGTYVSNWIDAEFYGVREEISYQVAHVDGQCLAIKKDLLQQEIVGPMITLHPEYFLVYDAWLSCAAREKGLDVVMVGVSSYHVSWLKGDGMRHHRIVFPEMIMKPPEKIRHHQGQNLSISRKYLSERYKDILPIKVE